MDNVCTKKTAGMLLLIFAVLILDQASKIWVKTNMQIGDSIRITNWFYIHFVENNGMAFGLEPFKKIFLSLFRIVVVGYIGYYLFTLLRRNYPFGYIATISLVFAGAMGNIIDSVFYGVIFNHSFGQVATMLPSDGGYAPYFYGQVVDMLYFPFFTTTLPGWIPFWGGKEFAFFKFIFNVADSAVSVGGCCIFLFYLKTFSKSLSKPEKTKEA